MLRLVVILAIGMLLVYGVSAMVKSSDAPSPVTAGEKASGAVEIVPANAHASSTLELRLADTAGSRGEVATCRWFKNGSEIAGATSGKLEPGHFRKGDTIEAETTFEGGRTVKASPVRIGNTPPRIIAASANLRPEPSATIYVEVSAVDADNDPISYRYAWFVNGKELPQETGATINVARFQKSDKVHATVVASDGEAECGPVVADKIEMGSNAPTITSVPPQTLEEGRRFVYQVKTSMADVKFLRFDLVGAPDGMTVTRSGRIEWVVPATEGERAYEVVVRVSDPTGGESTQRIQIATAPLDSTR